MVWERGQEFVDGSSIQMSKLVERLSAAFILTIGGAIGAIIGAAGRLWSEGLLGIFNWVAAMLDAVFDAPINWFTAAWEASAAAFPITGPFDFAVAVGVVAVTFSLAWWTLTTAWRVA